MIPCVSHPSWRDIPLFTNPHNIPSPFAVHTYVDITSAGSFSYWCACGSKWDETSCSVVSGYCSYLIPLVLRLVGSATCSNAMLMLWLVLLLASTSIGTPPARSQCCPWDYSCFTGWSGWWGQQALVIESSTITSAIFPKGGILSNQCRALKLGNCNKINFIPISTK